MPGESEQSVADREYRSSKSLAAMRGFLLAGRGGVAGARLALSDMELRIVDEVVFKLGSQAVDQRLLRLGRE